MSRRRKKPSAYVTPLLYEDGWPLCRWCHKKAKTKKSTFCSKSCVHEWKVRTQPAYVRSCLFKRDGGICHDCRLDTELQRKALDRCSPSVRDAAMAEMGIPSHRKTLWDAHHVLPVALGGGESGLDNFITLCIVCHRGRTAAQKRT